MKKRTDIVAVINGWEVSENEAVKGCRVIRAFAIHYNLWYIVEGTKNNPPDLFSERVSNVRLSTISTLRTLKYFITNNPEKL